MGRTNVDPATGAAPTFHATTRSGWRWVRRLLLLVLVAGGGYLLLHRPNANTPTVQYKTEPVKRGKLVVTVTASGNLEPTNQVAVGSEMSGIAQSVLVDYNDHVKVGQVLATLDTTKLKAQIAQTKATLASAKAQVLSAQATVKETHGELERLATLRKLTTSKAVSQHDLDAAQAALDRAVASEAEARAQVSQGQASLDANETDLGKMQIRSPIDGVVLTRSIDPGQTVAASFQAPELFVLAEDLTKMQLHVDVDEADVGLVKDGQEATFSVDAYADRIFPARIQRVNYGSETNDGVVTYETVLDVSNPDQALRPGMTATATIVVNRIENALLVPNAALRFAPPVNRKMTSGGGSIVSKILPHPPPAPAKTRTEVNGAKKQPTVWVLRNGQPEPVVVTLGETDGSKTEVRGGELKEGSEVILDTVKVTQ